MSVPWPIAPMPAVTAAAAPPEEPPGVKAGSRGFLVAPCRRLLVNQRAEKVGVLVRPRINAPAARRLATTGLSSAATRPRCATIPFVVAKPCWSVLTFTVTGTPLRSPGGLPAASARFDRLGLRQHVLRAAVDHGVDRRVDRLEPRQRVGGQLARAHLARCNEASGLGCRQSPELGGRSHLVLSSRHACG